MISSQYDGSVISALKTAFQKQIPVDVSADSSGRTSIVPLSLWSRICHWHDAQFHEQRFSRISATVAMILNVQGRMSIEQAAHDPTLKVARKLLKKVTALKINTPEIQILKKEITSAKFGLDSSTLDRNAGLQRFIEKYHLERYLLHYNHTISFDNTSGEVSLLKNRVFTPWSTLAAEIDQWQPFSTRPVWAWIYGEEGIRYQNLYEWSEFTPFKKGDPAEWHHQYVFEICCCYSPESAKNGNHSWVRLKTPSGDIYSAGLYRPDKPDLSHNFKSPFRIKPAYLMQPDVSEFWDFPISTLSVKIDEEIFHKMKRMIEEDKKNDDVVFQAVNHNCLLYCKKVGALADIDIDTEENMAGLFLPGGVVEKVESAISYLPTIIQRICSAVGAFFINIVQILLGANLVDKDLNPQQQARATPHICNIRDLFDIRKSQMNHPSTFSFKTLKRIQELREQAIRELETLGLSDEEKAARINHIQLSLPTD